MNNGKPRSLPRKIPHKTKMILAIVLTILTSVMIAFAFPPHSSSLSPPLTTTEEKNISDDAQPDPILTEKRKKHILYGDQTGGGHLHGQNKACKSEFPATWSEEKIIDTVTKLAANDNVAWRQSRRNGNWVSDHKKEGLSIRIVLDDDREHIITAYPTNVKRNPCPVANDNIKD